jgi:hypothetical protein
MGLTLDGLWSARQAGANVVAPGFGNAKRCIFMFMWGGPSQLDTWDLKPHAPVEIRGEFKPIATNVPGTFIGEHFPRLAKMADQYAIVRSMTHEDTAHLSSAHHVLTGHHAPRRFSDATPPSAADWPQLGSALAKLRPTSGNLPSCVTMPWIVSHPAAPGGRAPGQHGGWLGSKFSPMTVGDPNEKGFHIPGVGLPADVPFTRLSHRRELLEEADKQLVASASWNDLSDQAFSLLTGSAAQRAFELSEEPASVRDRYGRNTHGQSLLLARRLAEAGVPLVTVNWHDDHQAFWDTHDNNFRKLKGRLMPTVDLGFSALMEDLRARGMLDETLLVWVGEFGRRPRITPGNGGREHWSRCFSAVLAGGGIRGGVVHGSSDKIAAYPREFPTSPGDLAATVFHALGIGPEEQLVDRQGVTRTAYAGAPLLNLF